MAMPVRETSGHNLRVVNLHLHLRISGKRTVKRIEQKVAMETMPGRHQAIQLELEILVVVEPRFHCPAPRSERGRANIVWRRVDAQSPARQAGFAGASM